MNTKQKETLNYLFNGSLTGLVAKFLLEGQKNLKGFIYFFPLQNSLIPKIPMWNFEFKGFWQSFEILRYFS